MAHVDRQVDLLALDDLYLALVLLHVHSHELIADFWGMFCTIYCTKFLLLKFFKVFWFRFCVVLFALPPPYFIQAFAEKDDESEHSLVEGIVDLLGDVVEVEGKDLIN